MKIVGIVAEYNPFHNLHVLHIEESRKLAGGDTAVVCVMSGDFVQRGEAAVFSKYARAEAAIVGGADLVLEHVFEVPRIAPGYMEPEASTAEWGADGTLTVWVSSPVRNFTPSSICLLTRGPSTSPALA